MSAFSKLACVLYNTDIVGLSFGLLSGAIEGDKNDAIRATFAIAGGARPAGAEALTF